MSTRLLFATACILAIAANSAGAAAPNYTYAEIAFAKSKLEGDVPPTGARNASTDLNGFKIEGSIAPLEQLEQLFFRGSFADIESDDVNDDISLKTTTLGVGWFFSLGDNNSVDVSADYREDVLDARSPFSDIKFKPSADGFGASVGFRSNIIAALELYARAGVLTGDYNDTYTFDAGGVWTFADSAAVTLSYEYVEFDDGTFDGDLTNGELSQVQAGFRVNF